MSPKCRRPFAMDLKPVRLTQMVREMALDELPTAFDALLKVRRVAATS